MLTVAVLRMVVGAALLGTVGVVIAVVTQAVGMMILDGRLEARDQREFGRKGWPRMGDFPVVGQPGWRQHRMTERKEWR